MLKKLFSLSFILLASVSISKAQVRIEGQLGGSNFLGYTANFEDLINLDNVGVNKIGVKLGAGGMLPGWPSVPTVIIHTGVNYYRNNWGLGSELSGFALSPFNSGNYYTTSPDIDMMIYPNISYTFKFKKSRYLKISGGAFLAYEKMYFENGSVMKFAGDVIPGIGISFGSEFFKKCD